MTKLNASRLRRRLACENGQAVLEFALVVPLVLVLVLGVVEVSYALLDQHIVSKLSREGSNLISRDTSLADAATAMTNMSSRPVNFTDGSSTVIFSVVKNVATVGASNYGKSVLYARYRYGSYSGSSILNNTGGSFGSAPDYEAFNSDNDTSLQITNLPTTLTPGDMLYVTEIYTRHPIITPFDKFGITVPQTLYSIAYF
jgi:hypothetical protein